MKIFRIVKDISGWLEKKAAGQQAPAEQVPQQDDSALINPASKALAAETKLPLTLAPDRNNPIHTFNRGGVTAFAASSDNLRNYANFAVGSSSGENVMSGPEGEKRLDVDAFGVTAVGISSTGIQAISTKDGSLVFNLPNTSEPKRMDLKEGASAIAFSQDGYFVAVALGTKIISMDLDRAPKVKSLNANVRSLAFSMDGKELAAGCDDGYVRVLDMYHDLDVSDALGLSSSPVNSVAYSKLGCFAAGTENGYVYYYPEQGTETLYADAKDRRPVGSVAFSPNGKLFAVGRMSVIDLWDTYSWKQVGRFETPGVEVVGAGFANDATIIAGVSTTGPEKEKGYINRYFIEAKKP